MSVSGPSFFVEPYNVSFTPMTYSTGSSSSSAISIYGVTRITLRQKSNIVYGNDNNKTRPVSAHAVTEETTVDIETTDGGAAIALQTHKGTIGNLTFDWKPSANQLTTSPTADQLVTIKGVCIHDHNPTAPSKANGTFTISGTCMQVSDNSDPVTFGASGN